MVDRASLEDELAEKLEREDRLRDELLVLLLLFFGRVRSHYAETGLLLPPDGLRDQLVSVLQSHGADTASTFASTFRDMVDGIPDSFAFELALSLGESVRTTAEQAANQIITTTSGQMQSALADALLDDTEGGQVAIAAAVGAILTRTAAPRAAQIATTETQKAAEGAKWAELQLLSARGVTLRSTGAPLAEAVKVWQAILDSRVRHWHAAANGQRQPLGEPFLVNGQRLRYPGDVSLGATASNIVNCRCSLRIEA